MLLGLLLLAGNPVYSEVPTKEDSSQLLSADFDKLPTYIKADTLLLKSAEHIFVYNGNVEVKHGDMIITSDSLEGKYDQSNQIQQLVALKNVTITRGEDVRANGERAVYEKSTESVTLTENPELVQNGSVLSADTIKIFLKENRSVAEGEVRVKLIKKETKPN